METLAMIGRPNWRERLFQSVRELILGMRASESLIELPPLRRSVYTSAARPRQKTLTHSQVLCPLETVPLIIGIGLNYRGHAVEAGVRLQCWLCNPNAELLLMTSSVSYSRVPRRVL